MLRLSDWTSADVSQGGGGKKKKKTSLPPSLWLREACVQCAVLCCAVRASLPSVIPPTSEELLGVRDLGLIRKGWEDLPGDKSRG